VILVDTSAWVEYLRATGSDVHQRVRELVQGAPAAELAVTEIVAMELLAGARDEAKAERLRRFLARFTMLPADGLRDAEAAAAIYRECRRAGQAVRSLTDCMIAAVAIRAAVPLLHRDRDYVAIARCSALDLAAEGHDPQTS
jgi:predicted nucleic acid-binding protein